MNDYDPYVATALRDLVDELPVSAAPATLLLGRATRARRNHRLLGVASAVAVVSVLTVGIAVTVGQQGGSGQSFQAGGGHGSSGPQGSRPAVLSGQAILLEAANIAEQAPEHTGNYWYMKITSFNDDGSKDYEFEQWMGTDGQLWSRKDKTKTDGKLITLGSHGFSLGGAEVSVGQLQTLPTKPDALNAWIADYIRHSNVRYSGGVLTADMQKRAVFDALVSLISELPAPPKVRAAAFQAIAAYPKVESLGAVKGGQKLQIAVDGGAPLTLVVDRASSLVRQTNWFVTFNGAEMSSGSDGGYFTLENDWTNELPN